MWNRDWPGWRIITVVCPLVLAGGIVYTPESLGLSQVAFNWLSIILTVLTGFAGTMSNSFAPGDKEIAAMSVGKAVITPTVASKAQAVETIKSLPTGLPLLALACASLLSLAACAGHIPPNASPETKLAIYADDAMKGVLEVQKLVSAGEKTGVIPPAAAAQVMIVADRVGEGGERLARWLPVYAQTTDFAAKQKTLAEITALLDRIDADLAAILKPLDESGEKAKLATEVLEVVRALWSIRLGLSPPAPVTS